jgi:hypothetical protein
MQGQQQQQQQEKQVWEIRRKSKKDDCSCNIYFYCQNCGCHRTHDTSTCFFLKDKTQQFKKRNLTNNDNASKKDRLFSCCTFGKEVNTLARKASKKNALGLGYMPAHLNASRTRNPRQNKQNAALSNWRIPPCPRIPCRFTTWKNLSLTSRTSDLLSLRLILGAN